MVVLQKPSLLEVSRTLIHSEKWQIEDSRIYPALLYKIYISINIQLTKKYEGLNHFVTPNEIMYLRKIMTWLFEPLGTTEKERYNGWIKMKTLVLSDQSYYQKTIKHHGSLDMA